VTRGPCGRRRPFPACLAADGGARSWPSTLSPPCAWCACAPPLFLAYMYVRLMRCACRSCHIYSRDFGSARSSCVRIPIYGVFYSYLLFKRMLYYSYTYLFVSDLYFDVSIVLFQLRKGNCFSRHDTAVHACKSVVFVITSRAAELQHLKILARGRGRFPNRSYSGWVPGAPEGRHPHARN
jgi:hypothetical protein